MGDSGWWVPTLTAMTALGASWVTGRGATSGVRVRAEVEARAKRVADQRDRRREAYRELSADVHALAAAFWRMEEVDRARPAERAALLAEIQVASRAALNRVEKSSRDVRFEGPANVAGSARELRRLAVAAHLLLRGLRDGQEPSRPEYDAAYQAFSDQHVRFIDAAREALELS